MLLRRCTKQTSLAECSARSALSASTFMDWAVRDRRSISCVVEERDRTRQYAPCTTFNLTHQRIHLLLLGAGTGRAPQTTRYTARLSPFYPRCFPHTTGVVTSSSRAFDTSGLEPLDWASSATPLSADEPTVTDELLDTFSRLEVPVLVDCTAAANGEPCTRALARGIHVVAANKKPLTIATANRNEPQPLVKPTAPITMRQPWSSSTHRTNGSIRTNRRHQ